jgi:hypothetical protein
MSQAKVTDFFATRKRARQDDILLNKDKKIKSNVEQAPTTRSTRASTRHQQAINAIVEATVPEAQEEPCTAVPAPIGMPLKAVNTKQKVSVAELKQRIQNFNKKLQKHKENYANDDNADTVRTTLLNDHQNDMQQQPAHEKYANLASKEYESQLVLPVKFQSLYDMFKGVYDQAIEALDIYFLFK